VASFSTEHQALREAAQQAGAAQEAAEAAAADAQQQLAMARAVLAERLGHAEREHKQQLAELQVRERWCAVLAAQLLLTAHAARWQCVVGRDESSLPDIDAVLCHIVFSSTAHSA
jgi:acyl-CoA reductase-like NAD-dependent aldehyde dehydrogenase